MTGLPAGEHATIGSDDGEPVFTYRSFTSVVPLVAMIVAFIVMVTGIAAVAFLFAESRPVPATIALVLSAAFTVLIAMLVPPTNVTIFHGRLPVLTIAQQSNVSFPVATFVVGTPDRQALARIRRSIWSRLGRNRWTILPVEGDRAVGFAVEESLSRALVRKVMGKFHPRYESNVIVHYMGDEVARIIRRPNSEGETDVLEITGELDHRVAVALGTLVLGSEP
jgi:hypothetical protein